MSNAPAKASELTLRLFTVASRVTGVFLLLIVVLYSIRLATQHELWAFGPNGFLSLEQYAVDAEGFKIGLPTTGLDLTMISLIVHGWLYVFYLYTDFRLWTETRWSFSRFVIIALGGVVPFLSFFTERRFGALAKGEGN
jgi:integral membrane protein